MKIIRTLCFAALVAAPAAAADAPWIHVRVTEGTDQKVEVNLPVSMIDVALASSKNANLQGGRLRFDGREVQVADIRKAWLDLRNAGDKQFVNVQEKDQTVRIERKAGRVLVNVDGRGAKREKVRIDVPVTVVDALFAGAGDSLNFAAAVAQLKQGAGEFVHVEDGNSDIRIWID